MAGLVLTVSHFLLAGADFVVLTMSGLARMAACTLLYVSSMLSAVMPALMNWEKWALYFSGFSSWSISASQEKGGSGGWQIRIATRPRHRQTSEEGRGAQGTRMGGIGRWEPGEHGGGAGPQAHQGSLTHVLGDVAAEDVLAEGVGVELLALGVVADEALLVVGDVEAAVQGALHDSEHLGAAGRALEARVEDEVEGAGALVGLLDVVVLAGGLLGALVELGHVELGQQSASEQEADAVGGGVVGEPSLEAESGELVRVGGADDLRRAGRGARPEMKPYQVGDFAAVGREQLGLRSLGRS